MNEIRCPKCGEVFQVDETGFAAIVKQVRDSEFEKEIKNRLKELEDKNPTEAHTAELKRKDNDKWASAGRGVPVDIRTIEFANIPTHLKPDSNGTNNGAYGDIIQEDEEFTELPNGNFKIIKKFANEKNYHKMPDECYDRPAQIPIRKTRLNYLLNEYSPKETDRWIMFNHPNHFVIYDAKTKYCIFDAEYSDFEDHYPDSEPICAVIEKIRINKDPDQYPSDIEDDFGTLADLLTKEL